MSDAGRLAGFAVVLAAALLAGLVGPLGGAGLVTPAGSTQGQVRS